MLTFSGACSVKSEIGIHSRWNPVKHGWVRRAGDRPHSSFHAYVRRGLYPAVWARDPDVTIKGGE
jgi:putative transposase